MNIDENSENSAPAQKPRFPSLRLNALGFAWGLTAFATMGISYIGAITAGSQLGLMISAGFSAAVLPSMLGGFAVLGAAYVAGRVFDQKFRGLLAGRPTPVKAQLAGLVAGVALVFGLASLAQNTAAKITFPQPGSPPPAPVSELAPLSPEFSKAGVRPPAGFTFAPRVAAPKLG